MTLLRAESRRPRITSETPELDDLRVRRLTIDSHSLSSAIAEAQTWWFVPVDNRRAVA